MDKLITHADYYQSVGKLAGINMVSWPRLEQAKKALENGDEHLNSIDLSLWDALAYSQQFITRPALKQHEDGWSLAGGVCIAKAMVKLAITEKP